MSSEEIQPIGKTTSERLAILEYEMKSISPVYNKLSDALDRLSEILQSLKQGLAIHEMRFEQNDKIANSDIKKFEELSDRVTKLESWRWYTLGAVVAIVTLIEIALNWSGHAIVTLH